MSLEGKRKINQQLDNLLQEERMRKQSEEDKIIMSRIIGEQMTETVAPILEAVKESNQATQQAINTLNSQLQKQQEILDKGIAGMVENSKIKIPDIKIPEIKIPKIETPKIPQISVPKSEVVVDTTNIEKTLERGLQSLKPPIVNVPEAKVDVKVPDFPTQMDIKGWVQLQGVDLANPLPVQLRTADGKPMSLGGGSSSGGGSRIANIQDNKGVPLFIDPSTEAMPIIDYAHHEIHEGDHYFVKGFMDLTNGQVFDFLATTPDTTKWIHMLVEFSAEAEANIIIYEGTTTSADGTAVSELNRDRNSSNTAGLVITHTPTVTGVGTQIAAYKMGSSNKAGGTARANAELILKQNTKYLIRITNDTALNNWFDYLADWYEHTNKH